MVVTAAEQNGTFAIVFIFLTLFLFLCLACTCVVMCCLAPIIKLFSILLVSICACFGFSSESSRSNRGYKHANQQYGNNHSYYNGYQQDELATAPIYHQDDLVVTDAYFVSPLVSAHVVKGEEEHTVVLGIVHESKEETQVGEESFQFKDIWFAVLFLMNLITIILLSVREATTIYVAGHMSTNEIEKDISSYSSKAEPVIVSCLVLGSIATIFGAVWLNILMNFSDFLIKGVMIVNIFMGALASLTFFLHENLLFGIIFIICTVFSYWYFISVQHRIPFATAVLATAIKAIKANFYGLMSTAYILLLVQVLNMIIWSVAMLGVVSYFDSYKTNNEDEENTKSTSTFLAYSSMIFSLYWSIEVIKNILQVTTAGAVATWYFQPERPSPVRGSLFRSLTTSIGSICFGSLLVAIVETVRDFVHLIRNKVNNNNRNRNLVHAVLICILDQILAWLEAAICYFNRYAFCYVAAWGKDYLSSGRDVMTLFTRRGWTAIINDDLISNVLSLSTIALSVLTGIIGYTFAFFVSNSLMSFGIEAPSSFLGMIGGAMGFGVGNVLVSLLHAAVSTIFVCCAEDPLALQKNHAFEFEVLMHTWESIHPGTMNIHINYGTQRANDPSAPMLPYANKV